MKITVKEAAMLLEKGEPFIRIGLQRSLLPIGVAMQSDPQRHRCKYSYFINPAQLAAYMGISLKELERRVQNAKETRTGGIVCSG